MVNIVSLRMNTGDFYFALPALTNNYSNEMFAAIAQIATFSWFGLACGIAYLFSENVELEPVKQGGMLFNFVNCWDIAIGVDRSIV